MTCEVCGKNVSGLYQICTGENAGKFACFDCQPADEVAAYPGWARREETRRAHAQQAKVNFQTKGAVNG